MCLYPTTNSAKVADHDIICYKVVQVDIGDKMMHSNHDWNHVYELDKTYRENRFNKKLRYEITYLTYGFHSYMKVSRAQRNAIKLNGCSWASSDGRHVIIKCIIPKGARYYEGSSGETAMIGEYCSNRIKVVAWRTMYGRWHTK